jgi:hypothetical protein
MRSGNQAAAIVLHIVSDIAPLKTVERESVDEERGGTDAAFDVGNLAERGFGEFAIGMELGGVHVKLPP